VNQNEVWTHIEQLFRERDWTGVAVMADALQEAGEERLAGCVRWMAEKKVKVGWVSRPAEGDHYYRCFLHSKRSTGWMGEYTGDTLPQLVETVQQEREYYQ
jgi:hypothetical protein